MEVVRVLHMNGGTGDTSYANNSSIQRKVISLTKTIMEDAIIGLYQGTKLKRLAFADLGCSSGPNTLLVVSDLISKVEEMSKKVGYESPEYQVFLNDLPGNDFNTIFSSLLPGFYEKIGQCSDSCFVNGVPGSFYGRLFPCNSLHFIHSSYSLQWLSQVPKGLEGNNKGNIYMASTSPASVLQAYYEQFQDDFSKFLGCRSDELVLGGRMVLTFLGRKSRDPSSKECCYIWELLAMALHELVSEGLIKVEELDSFNIPQYTPCPEEIQSQVSKQGSFAIDRLQVSEVNWKYAYDKESWPSDPSIEYYSHGSHDVAKCMRAVAEPLLVNHFGKEIIDDVFSRYRIILADKMSKERTEFINVVVSMTKTN